MRERHPFVAMLESGLAHTAPPYAVALSGGADSTALLAALTELGLTAKALHVDHGLHPDSSAWARRCRDLCERLGVELEVIPVTVERRGQGIEAEARRLRYDALAAAAGGGTVLTAHHAQDQLETLLLRLARGTGIDGLAGIHRFRRHRGTTFLRPLLQVDRGLIDDYVEVRGLRPIADPSNESLEFDRNFLRAQVLPQLVERWPAAPRLSQNLADAAYEQREIQAALAGLDLGDDHAPGLDRLLTLTQARRRNALRFLIERAGGAPPTRVRLERVLRELETVGPESGQHRWQWPGGELRLYRRRLYVLGPVALSSSEPGPLSPERPWRGSIGTIALEPKATGGIAARWLKDDLRVEFRSGGERIRPCGRQHRRSVKSLLREAGIVPWMRPYVPLVYGGGQLLAVADLWLAAEAVDPSGSGHAIRWAGRPDLF